MVDRPMGSGRAATGWVLALLLTLPISACAPQAGAPASSSGPAAEEAPKRPQVLTTLIPGSDAGRTVTCLHFDGKKLWIGTGAGLYAAAFDGASGTVTLEDDPELSARFASQAFTDLDGQGERIVAGTSFGYAAYTAGGGWIAEETGKVNSVAVDGDRIYLGRSTGVEALAPQGQWQRLEPQPPLSRNQTSAQHVRDLTIGPGGQLWVGTKFGLLTVTPPEGVWRHFYGSYQDIKSERVVTDEPGNADLAGNFVNQVRHDATSGRLLVGTDIGLSILDPASGRWKTYTGDHTKYIAVDGDLKRIPVKGNLELPSSEVHALALEGEVLWIGTRDGLVRLEGDATELFGAETGLPDDAVTALAVAPESRTVFVGTPEGLAVIGYR